MKTEYDFQYQKLFGLFERWIILRTADEFKEIAQLCEQVELHVPKAPDYFPCLVWLYDCGVPEVGPIPDTIYIYTTHAEALIAVHQELIAKRQDDPVEW